MNKVVALTKNLSRFQPIPDRFEINQMEWTTCDWLKSKIACTHAHSAEKRQDTDYIWCFWQFLVSFFLR